MEDFKKYLEQKEIELSKTTEFLAYYALPYIPNPRGHPTYEQLFKLYMKSKNFDRIIEISSQAVSIFHQMGDENNSKRFANIIHQAWHYKSMNEFRFIEYITEEENNYLYDKYGKDSVKKEVNKLTNQIEKRYNRNESIDGLVVTSKSRKLMSSLEYIL